MLETQNESWGFWGTMGDMAEAAWGYAFDRVLDATGMDDNDVRAFLDGRPGRHFADDVRNYLFDGMDLRKAIDAAIRRWMGWSFNVKDSHIHGVPVGTPYLIGMVGICGAEVG